MDPNFFCHVLLVYIQNTETANTIYSLLLIVMNVSFADVSIEVAEGVGFVKFLLLKTPGALGPVSVRIATQDGTATGNWNDLFEWANSRLINSTFT